MKRVVETGVGVLAIGFLGTLVFLVVRDVSKTRRAPREVPQAEKLATADLEVVQDPEKGWFPAHRQPVFSWEVDEEGWKLEAEDPLALSAVAPDYPPPPIETPAAHEGPKGPAPGDVRRNNGGGAKEKSRGLQVTDERSSARHAEALKTSGADSRCSLKVPVNFPDPATILRYPTGLLGVRYIAFDVFVPEEAKGYVGCLFFLKDKDGLWYQARSRTRLLPGAWTTVTLDVRGGSPDVEPLGHLGQWEENQASQVQTIGLTFYGDRPYEGHLWVDTFRGWMRPERFKPLVASLVPEGGPLRGPTVTEERRKELHDLLPRAEEFRPDPPMILNLRTDPPAPPSDAATPGENSAPCVGVYETFTIRFEINRQIANPFDPDQADVSARVEALASGKATEVSGFWYQDYQRADRFEGDALAPVGRPEWRVRMAAREPGEHRATVRVKLNGGQEELASAPVSFMAIPSAAHGFVRVSRKDPSYFEFEDGTFFYPIGHNIHTPVDLRCWKEIFKQDPPLDRGTKMYADFFPKMAAAGENVGEVWMAAWWLGIEWTRRWRGYQGLGRYSLENAWKLDRVLELARRNGIFLHLVIDNHGKFSQWCDWEWNQNPNNRSVDPNGPVSMPSEFFTNEKCRKLYKQRLRYLAARWGCDPTVLGWELVSEMDLVGDGVPNSGNRNYYRTPPAQAWVKEMMTALRGFDPYGRPVTNHYATDFNLVDRQLSDTPLFDYIVCDAYRQEPCFAGMATATARAFAAAKKPFWVTEFGGNWNATSEARLVADLHCGLWSSWMTPAGATPLFWWYDFIDRNRLYKHYRAFANFVQGEDKRGLEGLTDGLATTAGNNGELVGLCFRWSDGAYGWVYNRQSMMEMPEAHAYPKHEGVQALIPGLSKGRYRIEYWNTYSGKKEREEEVDTLDGQGLPLRFPTFENDMAVKVKRLK